MLTTDPYPEPDESNTPSNPKKEKIFWGVGGGAGLFLKSPIFGAGFEEYSLLRYGVM
jgi:hypothetical protein